ncbi:hypothetical protein I4U23_000775 [Adineta vaga]|nr:hypothetical protein I4U23_000775 [Adineta vaga]
MIGQRAIYLFTSLVFILVIITSSAPIVDKQLITQQSISLTTIEPINYDDNDKSESDETSSEDNTTVFTTLMSEIVTTDLPMIKNNSLPFDIAEILNGINPFPVEKEMVLPATPTTDFPEWFESHTFVYEQNN